MNIMILDDETLARDLIKYCVPWDKLHLELVYEGDDAARALKFMEENRVDIILTDITMPGMDGLEFTAQVCRKWPETDIIVITGYDEFEYARKGLRLGVADFILKPVDGAELEKALVDVLYRKARSRAALQEYACNEKNEQGLIGNVMEYLEANYMDMEMGLGKLADHFHVNASYLSRLFKQQSGVNFSEYLFELRMKKALLRLEQGDDDLMIYHLAEMVGFSDSDYFGRCFRKYTGMSFSQYKKQRKSGNHGRVRTI